MSSAINTGGIPHRKTTAISSVEIAPVFSAKYTNATIRIIGINTAPNKMILAFSEQYYTNNGINRKPTAI